MAKHLNYMRISLDKYRDKRIPKTERVRDALIDALPRGINYSNIMFLTGVSYSTAKRIIHGFVKSGLVRKVVRKQTSPMGKVTYDTTFKYVEATGDDFIPWTETDLKRLTGYYGKGGLNRQGYPEPLSVVRAKRQERVLSAMENGFNCYWFSETHLQMLHRSHCLPPHEDAFWTQVLPGYMQNKNLCALAGRVLADSVSKGVVGRPSAGEIDSVTRMALAGHLVSLVARKMERGDDVPSPVGYMIGVARKVASGDAEGGEPWLWSNSLSAGNALWMDDFIRNNLDEITNNPDEDVEDVLDSIIT